jgi:hypothetical protein
MTYKNRMIKKMSKSILSKEQILKLKKLDDENQKKKNENKKKSIESGIPEDLIGLDIVKLGFFLGIIKNKNEQSKKNLINLFFPDDEPLVKIDRHLIPNYFQNAYLIFPEKEKINHQEKIVQEKSIIFFDYLEEKIKEECQKNDLTLNSYIDLDSFCNTCLEMMNNILEDEDEPSSSTEGACEPSSSTEGACEPSSSTEGACENEVWKLKTVAKIRQSIFGFINQKEYCALLENQISKNKEILKYNSFIDNFLQKKFNSPYFFPYHPDIILKSLFIQQYKKNPELEVFNFESIMKEICNIDLMFVPLKLILKYKLIGLYNNNSLVYLPNETTFHYFNHCNSF